MKLVAIHTVVYGKGQTAAPNTPFDAGDDAAFLIEQGAAREPTDFELAVWGEAPAKKGKKAKGADAPAASDAPAPQGASEPGAPDNEPESPPADESLL